MWRKINIFGIFALSLINNEDEDETKSFTVNINLKVINAVASRLTLSLYLVESGIIEKQKDGSETIEEYEHNHMLRVCSEISPRI